MNITLTINGDAPIETTLASFLADNADGLDKEEVSAIREAMAKGETYLGGGGALPSFRLKPATT